MSFSIHGPQTYGTPSESPLSPKDDTTSTTKTNSIRDKLVDDYFRSTSGDAGKSRRLAPKRKYDDDDDVNMLSDDDKKRAGMFRLLGYSHT
jgi:hypothetical protein